MMLPLSLLMVGEVLWLICSLTWSRWAIHCGNKYKSVPWTKHVAVLIYAWDSLICLVPIPVFLHLCSFLFFTRFFSSGRGKPIGTCIAFMSQALWKHEWVSRKTINSRNNTQEDTIFPLAQHVQSWTAVAHAGKGVKQVPVSPKENCQDERMP